MTTSIAELALTIPANFVEESSVEEPFCPWSEFYFLALLAKIAAAPTTDPAYKPELARVVTNSKGQSQSELVLLKSMIPNVANPTQWGSERRSAKVGATTGLILTGDYQDMIVVPDRGSRTLRPGRRLSEAYLKRALDLGIQNKSEYIHALVLLIESQLLPRESLDRAYYRLKATAREKFSSN